MDGTVRHAGSGRPAFALHVMLLRLPEGSSDVTQGSFVEDTYTDRDGRYSLHSPFSPDYTVAFFRGKLLLGSASPGTDATIGLTGPLAEFAALLTPSGPSFSALRTKAQNLLSRVLRSDTIKSCQSGFLAFAYTSADGENPGIFLGSLLSACAIQLHFNRTSGQAYDDSAPARLATSIIRRFCAAAPFPGYIMRWRQASTIGSSPRWVSLGRPLFIDPCDPTRGNSGSESLNGNDARAEPSPDEYTGILFGICWFNRLSFDCTSASAGLCRGLLTDIDYYLKSTQYWLIKPCSTPDLCVRGSFSGFLGYGYDAAISIAVGRGPSDGGTPLQNHSSTLMEATLAATTNLAASPAVFAVGPALNQYSATISVAQTTLSFDVAAIGAIVLAPVALTVALSTGGSISGLPFGSTLFMMPFLPLAVVGTAFDVAFKTNQGLWQLFPQFIALGLNGKPFNVASFDRLSLAAAGNSFVEGCWQTSAIRPKQAGDDYIRVLATATALWMSNVSGTFDNPAAMLSEILSGLDNAGGYVAGDVLAGYLLLCLTLDIEPRLVWSTSDISYLDPLLLPSSELSIPPVLL